MPYDLSTSISEHMGYFRLLTTHPRSIGFGFLTAFFSGLGQTHFVALFSPHVMSHFDISNTEYGLLYSSVTLISGLLLTVVGPWLDRYDLRYFALATALGLTAAQSLLTWNHSLITLGLALFGLRFFGQGLCSSMSSISVARYFEKQRGKALALAQMGFPVAEGLMTPLFALLLSLWGFQNVGFLLITICILIYLPLGQFLIWSFPQFNKMNVYRVPLDNEGTSASTPVSPPRGWSRGQALKERTLYLLLPQTLLPAFALTGLLFHQAAIAQSKTWSLELMASGLIFFAIGRSLTTFATGPLVDRWQAFQLFPYYQIPMSFGFVILAWSEGPWTPAVCFSLFGLTVGSGGPIKSAIWAELYGVRHLGAIKSLFSTLMILATAASPALFGWLIDSRGATQTLLWGLFIFSLVASLLAGLSLKRFKKIGFLDSET